MGFWDLWVLRQAGMPPSRSSLNKYGGVTNKRRAPIEVTDVRLLPGSPGGAWFKPLEEDPVLPRSLGPNSQLIFNFKRDTRFGGSLDILPRAYVALGNGRKLWVPVRHNH